METPLPYRDPNLYEFFIADENGTSQYLATLLDPRLPEPFHPFQNHLWGHWRRQLTEAGITLRSSRPADVSMGYRTLDERELERPPDIVIRWDDWILSLENKIRPGAIRKDQLQEQYSALCGRRDRDQMDKNLHIGMIFLTPTVDIGKWEFSRRLQVKEGDAKAHVSWHMVLDWIDEFGWEPMTFSNALALVFRSLVTSGSVRVHELVKPPERAPFAPPYDALKDLVDQICKKVEVGARSLSFYLHQNWTDGKEDFIWSTWKIKGIEGRSVTLLVYADGLVGASQERSEQRLAIHGKVAFYVEKGAKTANKKTWSASVHELSQPPTRTIIEKLLPEGDGWASLTWPDGAALGNGGDVVVQEFRFEKDWDEEVDTLASRVVAFLIAFRSVMYP